MHLSIFEGKENLLGKKRAPVATTAVSSSAVARKPTGLSTERLGQVYYLKSKSITLCQLELSQWPLPEKIHGYT